MISVIIPAYNREKVIKKSIESVLNQTIKNIEVIVVDDGSKDNTKNIVMSIKDERLKYIYQENAGACAARNRGIAEAKGEYIAFHDSDDEWLENKLEKQIMLLDNGADFVSCGMRRNTSQKIKKIELDYDITISNLLKYNIMSTQTMIMKKEVCEKVKFDTSFKKFQDWDYVLQVFIQGFKIDYVNELLVVTNDSENSITSNVNTEKACQHLIEKYRGYYSKFPKSLAYIYMLMARSLRNIDNNKTEKYLIESMKLHPTPCTLLKIIFNKFSLWNR